MSNPNHVLRHQGFAVGYLTVWLLASFERFGPWDPSQCSAENARRMSRGIPSVWD